MMQALHAGMPDHILASTHADQRTGNIEHKGYVPNPGPLLEVGGNYLDAKFLRELPDNVLIKIFFDGLPNLPAGDYKVIFMIRDEWEINDSCKKADKHLRAIGVPENLPSDSTFYLFRPYNQDDIDHVLGICEARSDISLIKVNYSDVIKHPKHEFETLRLLGVPIDPAKAAAVIDPEYYRSRK
jgi:hypothetical protein